jgi:Zn-dependent protease
VAILVRSGHLSVLSVIFFLVLVPSVVLHEVSHGWVADLCGDDTARRAGRLTLNPLAHVDLVGTIIVPVVMILSGVGAFGWAKPVPVNVSRLRHPRNQAVLVSLTGPATNILLALLAAGAYRLLVPHVDKLAVLETGLLTAQPTWAQVVFMVGYVNVLLAAFNLIPLPPLDGSAVLERLLPAAWLPGYYRIRPFTLILPLALIVLSSLGGPGGNILNDVFSPVLNWWGHVVGL